MNAFRCAGNTLPELSLDDELFGHLDWSAGIARWSGNAAIAPDVLLDVTICPDGFDTHSVLANARKTFLKLRESFQQAGNHIADRLLVAYNDGWNDDSPVSRDVFISRITPAAIGLYHDGSADFLYEDGGQFGCHAILIHVSVNGEFGEVTIEG